MRILENYGAYEIGPGLAEKDADRQRMKAAQAEKKRKEEEEFYNTQLRKIMNEMQDMQPSQPTDAEPKDGQKEDAKRKVCRKCGRDLPVESFYRRASTADGFDYYCKACKSKLSAKWNKERRIRKAVADAPSPMQHETPAEEPAKEETAFGHQIGGNHYASMAMQPATFIMANALGFCEGNVVKYVCRWQKKGGVEDLEKARHYLDMLIEYHSL